MAQSRAVVRRRSPAMVRARPRHHKKEITIPLSIAVGLLPTVGRGMDLYKQYGFGGLKFLAQAFIPYDLYSKKFYTGDLVYGLYPVMGGALVHALANKLGINRALKNAGVPLLRI